MKEAKVRSTKRDVRYKDLTIGIYSDSFNGKTGVTFPYMNFLQQFGDPYLITTKSTFEKVNKNCDAIIVPGGADVNPARYNEAPHPTTSRANAHYEWMDEHILKPFLETGKPVFGICRGFQTINVLMGGTLFQNMSYHVQVGERSSTPDELTVPDDNGNFVHYPINTLHHQAIKKLGDNLIPIGFSAVSEGCETLNEPEYLHSIPLLLKNDKKLTNYYHICEAFRHKVLPILAVQYHPEEINCSFAINAFDNLLNNAYAKEEERMPEMSGIEGII